MASRGYKTTFHLSQKRVLVAKKVLHWPLFLFFHRKQKRQCIENKIKIESNNTGKKNTKRTTFYINYI